jgi:hypothetical protein
MTVKFMDHTPLHLKHLCSADKRAKVRDPLVQATVLAMILKMKKFSEYNLISSEIKWANGSMPFFNIYPQVASALCRTSLNLNVDAVPKSIVQELRTICVRFSECSPIKRRHGVGWFFMDFAPTKKVTEIATLSDQLNIMSGGKPGGFSVAYQTEKDVFSFAAESGMSFSESELLLKKDLESDEEAECRRKIASIALGVMLLAADPDYIKPVLLKADEGKTTSIEDRIARAKNRGVFGFTIGEDIERSPHFRRPHFAIRWTGKGGTIPKLVPVKGAIIGKEIMTTVPTGFEQEVSQSLN